jgi:DNA invertase Pin-like site-specific DNA recombinase
MRKAYSYIRMSSEKQLRGDSLRRQLELSEQYAKEFNLELVDHIDGVDLKDLGVSGYQGVNSKKGVLALFLNALEIGKIPENSILLIESLDRLSRDDISSALTQFLNIINYNIEIVTLTDRQSYTKATINDNPAQIYISLGVMFRANEESATKSKRISAAWKNKRNIANIIPLTKIAPAWLTYVEDEQKFLLNEERTKVIKLIFDMCTNTCGLWSITRYLNENKIPTFGTAKIWYKSYINKIIFNRAVIGEFQPHKMIEGKRVAEGEAIKEYFPAAITESEFLLAHAAVIPPHKSSI